MHFPGMVPPPTPPPTGPLPSVPPLVIAGKTGHGLGVAAGVGTVGVGVGGHMRKVRPPSTAPPMGAPPPIPDEAMLNGANANAHLVVVGGGSAGAGGNGGGIQRGRESPFPSRPSPENGRREREDTASPASASPSPVPRMQRGRELPFPRHPYAAAPTAPPTSALPPPPLGTEEIVTPEFNYRSMRPPGFGGASSSQDRAREGHQEREDDGENKGEGDEDDDGPLDAETLMNEFNLIRKRFNAHDRERFSTASVPVTEPDRYKDSFISASTSKGLRHESFTSGGDQQLSSFDDYDDDEEGDREEEEEEEDRSLYPDDEKSAGRRTMYLLEGGRDAEVDADADEDEDNRFSRFSARVQSVYSVLDGDKSEEARKQFVRRVTAMYGDGGRARWGEAGVPPVPELPDGLVIRGTGVGRRRVDV